MRRMLLILSLVLVVISACTGGDTSSDDPSAQGDGAAAGVSSLHDLLDWDRSPEVAVVRLDTVGTSGYPADDLNTLPFCALFGDGHVVWVDPFAEPEQVLEAHIDETVFRTFLEYVIGLGFYSWDSDTGELSPPTEEPDEGPIVEQITLALYGETRTMNTFSSWPVDAFANVLEHCQHLSDAPVLYVPTGAWLSAIPVEARSDIPRLPWRVYAESFPELNLGSATLENPLWITDELAAEMWEIARAGRMQVIDNGVSYRIVVQVPVIQPYAPPPPAETPASEDGS